MNKEYIKIGKRKIRLDSQGIKIIAQNIIKFPAFHIAAKKERNKITLCPSLNDITYLIHTEHKDNEEVQVEVINDSNAVVINVDSNNILITSRLENLLIRFVVIRYDSLYLYISSYYKIINEYGEKEIDINEIIKKCFVKEEMKQSEKTFEIFS